MKFIQVTGYGNNIKHIISLRSIADITFESQFTRIILTNGRMVNVIENESTILDMIDYQHGIIVNKERIDQLNARAKEYEENYPF
jgi:hypothetical protein